MPGETAYTTITVPEAVKDDLDEERNGQPWGSFLEELRREYADPITLNDAQKIAEQIKAELDQSDVSTNDKGVKSNGHDVSTNGSGVNLNVDDLAESVAEQISADQSVTVENVTIETEESGVSAEEVEGIVEGWVERNADKLRKGQV